jgi:hypothetical protein
VSHFRRFRRRRFSGTVVQSTGNVQILPVGGRRFGLLPQRVQRIRLAKSLRTDTSAFCLFRSWSNRRFGVVPLRRRPLKSPIFHVVSGTVSSTLASSVLVCLVALGTVRRGEGTAPQRVFERTVEHGAKNSFSHPHCQFLTSLFVLDEGVATHHFQSSKREDEICKKRDGVDVITIWFSGSAIHFYCRRFIVDIVNTPDL